MKNYYANLMKKIFLISIKVASKNKIMKIVEKQKKIGEKN